MAAPGDALVHLVKLDRRFDLARKGRERQSLAGGDGGGIGSGNGSPDELEAAEGERAAG